MEDELRKRWEQEAKDKADREREEEARSRPKKRVRAIEYNSNSHCLQDSELDGSATGNVRTTAKIRGPMAKKPSRAASARAKNVITEIVEEDDIVELN